MDFLSPEQLRAAGKKPRVLKIVNVPELGGAVRIGKLSSKERDAWEKSRQIGKGRNQETNLFNIRASLLVVCLRTADGRRLFSDADIDDVGNIDADVVNRLFQIACDLNGIGKDDIEDLAKNSGPTEPASLGSDSAPLG